MPEIQEGDSEHDEEEEEEEKKKNELKTWRSNLISESADTVYIEQFKGSPLCIEVSIFKQTRVNEKQV